MPARVKRRNTKKVNRKSSKSKGYRTEKKYEPRGDFDQFKGRSVENINRDSRNVFLFDSEDFYGLTLEMVLFNFGFDSPIQIGNKRMLNELKSKLGAIKDSDLSKSVVIIDELFLEQFSEVKDILKLIKSKDNKVVSVFTTTISEPDQDIKDQFDYTVVKSSRSNEKTLIKTLSEILEVEFVADNSDPEHDYQ